MSDYSPAPGTPQNWNKFFSSLLVAMSILVAYIFGNDSLRINPEYAVGLVGVLAPLTAGLVKNAAVSRWFDAPASHEVIKWLSIAMTAIAGGSLAMGV